MDSILRMLSAIAGLPILGNGLMFLIDPQTAARQLAMPLLDGMARSTQIGDFAAFFLCGGIAALGGAWNRSPLLLGMAALLVGGAALCRLLASALHDAPVATVFILVECVLASLWIVSAGYFHRQRGHVLANH
jgi:hypothetical protein